MPGDYVGWNNQLYARVTLFLEENGEEFENISGLVNKAVAEFLYKRGVELPSELVEKYKL